jgi:hypothetical protein
MSTIGFFSALAILVLQVPESKNVLNATNKEVTVTHSQVLVANESIKFPLTLNSSQGLNKSSDVTQDSPQKIDETVRQLQKDLLEAKNDLGTIKDYNDKLLNTVFFALVGTVSTIVLGVFALNFFADLFKGEIQKNDIKQKVIDDLASPLRDYMNSLSVNNLKSLQERINWLEYQVSSTSASNLSNQSDLGKLLSVQSRIQAIKSAVQLQNNHQGDSVEKCVNYELSELTKVLEGCDLAVIGRKNPQLDITNIHNALITYLKNELREIGDEMNDNMLNNKAECMSLLVKIS